MGDFLGWALLVEELGDRNGEDGAVFEDVGEWDVGGLGLTDNSYDGIVGVEDSAI